ncbi:MAG: AAA family ATPase, partial [Anaerolineales bacterium]
MARLNLRLLGSPRVEHDGQPIEVDTRKAIALLAYLALSAEAHPRAALAALFWPDVDEARAHAALRRTLSALNKALGGQHLLIEREALGLEHGPDVWVDVEQFHQKLAECLAHGHPASKVCPACLSPLTEAAALYRGDFLSGFTLRDSPGFDDWQFFQAESLRRELAGALERLVRGHSERGEFETAIGHARRWLSLDPLHEPAHRHLMQLYVHAGQRAAALRQYRECVRILEEELGVPPLEETTALYEAIKEQKSLGVWKRGSVDELSPTLPTPHALAPAPVPVSTYPLVGRAAEWARLVTLYDSIKTDGQLIVLEGEAGIGKTRLAEAFLQHARDKGAVALVAHCYAGEMNLAYAPFVEMLRAALAQLERTGKPDTLAQQPAHWVSESARLLPALAPAGLPPWSATTPLDTLGERGAQSRFFEGVSQLLFALCQGEAPGVLFFDDLHWADEASLDLLTYLARRLRGLRPRRTCLLAAWRGEQVPARHRLRHLLAEA